MQTDPQPIINTQPTALPQQPAADRKLLAPLWHTILLIVIVVTNSYFTAVQMPKAAGGTSAKVRMLEYGLTILLELFLLSVVWFGIRLRGVTIRDLVGGRWSRFEDVLIDIGIAAGFWFVALMVLAGVGLLLGLGSSAQQGEAKKLAEMLAPDNWKALALFIGLSSIAGVVEEIIFRGYLQRQFGALTGNIYIGLIISAIIFGAGHAYEGWRRMIAIAVFGAMFGLLTLWRKSLRPGMMAHAWHDSIAGIALYLVKRGVIPMK